MANKFTILTVGGITPSAGPLGASSSLMYIYKEDNDKVYGMYTVTGISGGLAKAKLAIAVGPTSTSDFESHVNSVDLFYGNVQSQEASAALGIGYNYQKMTWISGPAKGTICEGTGWLTMIGASIGASGSILNFKFVGLSTPQTRKDPYHKPEVRRTTTRIQ